MIYSNTTCNVLVESVTTIKQVDLYVYRINRDFALSSFLSTEFLKFTLTKQQSMKTLLHDLGLFLYLVPIEANYSSLNDVPDYIQKALPYFLILVSLEFFYSMVRGQKLYTFKDTIMSLSLGMVQQLLSMWAKEIQFVPYIFAYNYFTPIREKIMNNYSVLNSLNNDGFQNSALMFIVGLLGCDLGYYFFHRFAHEFHFLWVSHSVHHSGERYNLATALRQGSMQFMTSWVFYLPLAMIGLPVTHFLRHSRLNTLYQFWIHTEVIHRFPWIIELIFNTASHHRMHHHPPGNCNYGGVFIIWDRIFGTFQSENSLDVLMENEDAAAVDPEQIIVSDNNVEEDPLSLLQVRNPIYDYNRGVVYGLAFPMETYDPVYANILHAVRLSNLYVSGYNDNFFVGLYRRITMLISRLFSKRVNNYHFHIKTRLIDLIPDILVDWKYADKFLKDNNYNIFRYLKYIFLRMFRLPPNITEETIQENKLQLSNKEFVYIQKRELRELPVLSVLQKIMISIHFFITTLLVFSLLTFQNSKFLNESPYTKLLLSLLSVVSLQTINFYYYQQTVKSKMSTKQL